MPVVYQLEFLGERDLPYQGALAQSLAETIERGCPVARFAGLGKLSRSSMPYEVHGSPPLNHFLNTISVGGVSMSAIQTLLKQIVDYAGLFPPASVSLQEAAGNYKSYVEATSSWMLARLIIPASRLSELNQWAAANPFDSPPRPWRISALVPPIDAPDDALASAIASLETFNQSCQFAKVDMVESKITVADQTDATLALLPPSVAAFLEIPLEQSTHILPRLAANDRQHTFAKIRTGGVTPDLIPSPKEVADFLYQCSQEGVGLKATAGLHHPVRSRYPLTYEDDAVQGVMHGFMNVFLAACFAFVHKWKAKELQELLEETHSDPFRIEPHSLGWRDHRISQPEIQSTREQFAISFGSCSFEEPLADLIGLGWLETETETV